ncbi:MAG: hypothetical protein LBR53_04870 [Deltaproteobacteria bacterium]|nr:hypothetical protein [Deltaproteobacteria bacterium]
MRELAKKDKSVKFTQLFQHISPSRLAFHFKQLNMKAAPGVDGVDWLAYHENLKDNIQALVEKLHDGRYRPFPARRVYIPMGGGFSAAPRESVR